MANRIKGIIVEIGGDTSNLSAALKGLDSDISKTQSQLRDVNKLLKLDPHNTELLAQKHKLLSQAVDDTSKRLKELKDARKAAETNLKNYDDWKAAIQPVQDEISKTADKLNKLKKQRNEMEKSGDINSDAFKALQGQIDETSAHLDELKKRQKEINDEFGHPISPEQYDSLKREIIDTENKLKGLKTQADESAVALQKIAQAGEGLKKTGDIISGVGKALAPISAIAAAGLGAAAKTFADFDAQLSRVQGISGATGDEMEELKNQAIKLGGSTKFSAKEVADAYEYMGMAGWKSKQMLEGMPGVLALAAASGEDLATVCDILTDALTAFGLGAEDAGHFADVLAVAASSANTNVAMMGETFKYVAPLAGTLKLTAEDVAEVVGLMANSGIKASQAGTALRGGLSRLVKPTDEMLVKMRELGLAVDTFSEAEAKAQSDKLKQGYEARKKALADEEDALKKSLDKQYKERERAYDKETDSLKKKLDADYDEQKKAFDKQEDALKDSYDKQHDAAKAAADKQLEALKTAQEAEVAAFEKATDEKIAQIDRQYNENLKLIDENKYNQIKAVEDQIAALNAQTEAERAAIEEQAQAKKKAELQAKIDSAKTAEERKKAEEALAAYVAELEQKQREAERKAQIEELKAQKDAIKEQADAEKAALKEQADADKAALKEERKTQLDELKQEHAERQAELKENNDQSLKVMKEAQESALSATKASNSEYLAELKEANQAQIAELKEANSERLSDYKEQLDQQKAALKEHHDAELSEFKANVDAQTDALKDAVSTQSLILTDENGEMRSLNDSVTILRDAFSGLSESEQAEAATILFGQEAMSGWLAVLNAAPKDIEDLHTAIANCDGAAQNMAETMSDNAKGDITELTSAVESLAISFGELLDDGLREIVKALKEVVDWVNNLDKDTKERIAKIGLLVAALSPLLIGLGGLVSTVGTIMTLAPKLGAAMSVAKGAVALFTGPVGIAVGIVVALGTAFITAYKKSETFRNGVNKVVGWITDKLNAVKNWGKDLIDNFVSGLDENPVFNAVHKIAKTIFDILHFSEPEKGPLANFHTFAPDMVQTFADGINANSGLVETAANGVAGLVRAGLDAVTAKLADVKTFWADRWNDIRDASQNAGEQIREKCAALNDNMQQFKDGFAERLSRAADSLNGFRDGASKAWADIKQGASTMADKLADAFGSVRQSASDMKDKVIGAFGSMRDAISDKINAAKNWGKDLIANFTGGIQDNLSNLESAVDEMAETVSDRVGFSKPKKGPLSDADTYAPDMMALLAKGIRDNLSAVRKATDSVGAAIKDALTLSQSFPALAALAKAAVASTSPVKAALSAPLPSTYLTPYAYQNAVRGQYSPVPGVPAQTQRQAPVTLNVNNIVGGRRYAQLQYVYDEDEKTRRGKSFVKL